MRVTLPLMLAAPLLLAAAPAPAPIAATPGGQAVTEALEYYCADWVRAVDGVAAPRSEQARAAGWTERRAYPNGDPTKAQPSGNIQNRSGEWGGMSVLRQVLPDGGHRCTVAVLLRADPWTTTPQHDATVAFVGKMWPDAIRAKYRADGPRNSKETIWHAKGDIQVTLQEAQTRNAPPGVFIIVVRQKMGEV